MAPTAGAGRGPNVRTSGTETIKEIRRTDFGIECDRTVNLASGNGETPYGAVAAGTPLGKITSGGHKVGYYRPCGKAVLDGIQTAVNILALVTGQAANLYDGDVVSCVRPSTGATIFSARTLSAVNKTTDAVTVSGAAVTVADGDILVLDNGAGTASKMTTHAELTVDFDRLSGALNEEDQVINAARFVNAKSEDVLVGWNDYIAEDLVGVTVD